MLLGAKYAPCMRPDQQLLQAFEREREAESRTGCCVYNTGSGCYQSAQDNCQGVGCHWRQPWPLCTQHCAINACLIHSPHLLSLSLSPLPPKVLTTFVYNDSSVNPPQPSRVVCGQSPRTCLSPASIPPQTWDQNIVNWPVGEGSGALWGSGCCWVQSVGLE